MDNNFSALLLDGAGLSSGPAGLQIAIRLPWYRALPLSVVEVASLSVDGRAVPGESIRFGINGKRFRLAELSDQVGEFWFVLDDAVLHLPGSAQPGTPHEVELQLNLYPPYIPHLTWVTRSKRTLVAKAAA